MTSARDLRNRYERRELSPVEIVSAALERQATLHTALNAFVTPTPELALAAARAAEKQFGSGAPAPALAGIPIAVKDLFDVAGEPCTCGSAVLASNVAASDAPVVGAVRGAGAAVVGKAATHEFAWGITSENAHFGNCRNPWDPARIPGGSSGGSAVAVATGQAVLALGTDTAGSVRIPAAFCGVIGFKPSYGLLSTAGIFPLAPSLDHAGLLGRYVEDVATAFDVLLGPAQRHLRRAPAGLTGVRVGVLRVAGAPLPEPAIGSRLDAAAARLEGLGAVVSEVPYEPEIDPAAVLRSIQSVEGFHSHSTRGLFPARAGEYGPDVRGRLEAAAKLGLGDYLAGLEDRRRITASLMALFAGVDLLLSPIAPCPPPRVGDTAALRDQVLPHTVLQNLAGVPACAFPIGSDEQGLPVGAQITGPPFGDLSVLGAIHAFAPLVTIGPAER